MKRIKEKKPKYTKFQCLNEIKIPGKTEKRKEN